MNSGKGKRAVWLMSVLLLAMGTFGLVSSLAAPVALAQAASSVGLSGPKNLVASAVNGNRVDLSWQDTSANEEGFRVQRASDRVFSRDLSTFNVVADRTGYSDESVKPASVYYYRVKAVTARVDSDWSNIGIVVTPYLVPRAPSGLSASSNRAFQVNLTWQDNSDNEAGFRIERALDDVFKSGLTSYTSGANVSNCTDNTVPAGTYYYRVLAFNKTADSPFSNVVAVTVGSKLEDGPVMVGLDTHSVAVDGFTSNPALQVNRLGVVQDRAVSLLFSDLKGVLDIAQGTTMLNAAKQPLLNIVYSQPSIVPLAPAGKVVLDVFELGPSFSTFNSAINLTIIYEPAALPNGQDPKKDLGLAFWDGSAWQMIAGLNVDIVKNQVSFQTTHFCTFMLLRPEVKPGPPFTISNLNVFPQYSDPGQVVNIWAEVKNNGPDPGNYNLLLKLNNKVEENRAVSLDVLESATINFNLVDKAPGNYNIDLNGLTGTMVIRPIAPVRTTTAAATTTSPLTESPSSIASPSPTPSATDTPAVEAPIQVSRPLFSDAGFGFLLGGILIVVAASLFIIFRRR